MILLLWKKKSQQARCGGGDTFNPRARETQAGGSPEFKDTQGHTEKPCLIKTKQNKMNPIHTNIQIFLVKSNCIFQKQTKNQEV